MSYTNQFNSRHSLPVDNNCYPPNDQSSNCQPRHQAYNSLQNHYLPQYYIQPRGQFPNVGFNSNDKNSNQHQAATVVDQHHLSMTQQVTNFQIQNIHNNLNHVDDQHLANPNHHMKLPPQPQPVPPPQTQSHAALKNQETRYSQSQAHNSNHHNMAKDDNNSTNYRNYQQDYHTERVIQAILAAKDAMEKPIEERDQHDILLIDHLCSLVHGFDSFPKTIRRALAAQAVLIVIEEKGKKLIVHGEPLDSFCVLIFGACLQLDAYEIRTIRRFQIGDAFGVCEPTTETVRFDGNMITESENCAFLCVKRDDFYTILTDPANYPIKEIIRHRDHNGNVICISQLDIDKKSSAPLWSQKNQNSSLFKLPDGHIIVKGNEYALLMSLVDGYDMTDSEYIDDFLLLFRVFMTDPKEDSRLPPGMVKLCLFLKDCLNQREYRDKIVKIVLEWLSSYYFDFEIDAEFSYLFLNEISSTLIKLEMSNHLQLLHSTLSAKSKVRNITISRSSKNQPLGFSLVGGGPKHSGIFVKDSAYCRSAPFDSLKNYLSHLNYSIGPWDAPAIPPRAKTIQNQPSNNDNRILAPLRPGDQIMDVNGLNFSAITLEEAQNALSKPTHYISLTVKYNPASFYDLLFHRDSRRKTPLSSVSSTSPYLPQSGQTRFTYNLNDIQTSKQGVDSQGLPPSPLFLNPNSGLKSIIKDKSKLASIISSSKSFVKQFRDSTLNPANLDSMSRASDNISDDQSNELDLGKTKSNPELTSLKSKELAQIIRLDNLNLSSVTDNTNNFNMLVSVLRVFNASNNESRCLLVHDETSARDLVTIAVRDFNLLSNASNGSQQNASDSQSASANDWYLYEVSYDPESKTIKKKLIPDQTTKLCERSGLCSRYYIKNNSATQYGTNKLDETDNLRDEIVKESPPSVSLSSLNATLLAVELTLSDFDKFKAIEPQQFVYDTFFNYNDRNKKATGSVTNGDSASLKSSSSDGQDADPLHILNKSRVIPKVWMKEFIEFADISNKEMFWVVCEILNERNLARRVKIVKQFIRIADVCSQLRNYNSMFAIISGLGNSCVSRLKRTLEKLKPKYKNQLEKMRSLFDPSRNMSSYRTCLQQTPPPAIPLFPQIKKDLTFTKEGRSIFVRETNDLSDDEDQFSTINGYSQDTVRRRGAKVAPAELHNLDMRQGFGNDKISRPKTSKPDSILINFAEIRKFTQRVRDVTYYSSSPYSNDLLTNTKDGQQQRSQAHIKRMHDECQMRKRIRHYLRNSLDMSSQDKTTTSSSSPVDQVDSGCSSSLTSTLTLSQNGRLCITYDERALYQRSIEIEPELNQNTANRTTHPGRTISAVINSKHAQIPHQQDNHSQQSSQPPTPKLIQPIPPLELTMQPPFMYVNNHQSPTLSKSSSLSSCSSAFIPAQLYGPHQSNQCHSNLCGPNRNNLMSSSVGKFGTESTESLRKLRALSENMDNLRPYANQNGIEHNRTKSVLPSSRMIPPKGSR